MKAKAAVLFEVAGTEQHLQRPLQQRRDLGGSDVLEQPHYARASVRSAQIVEERPGLLDARRARLLNGHGRVGEDFRGGLHGLHGFRPPWGRCPDR